MLVRDAGGRGSILISEGDHLRDTSGKVVAHESGSDAESRKLSLVAGEAMSGRKVLLDLGVTDVSQPSTQAEVGIPAGEYVADIASRVRFVTHHSGVVYTESALDAIQLVVPDISSAGGGVPEISPSWSPQTFTAQSYALRLRLPRLVGNNADFDIKRRATIRLVEALKLWRESRIATQLTTSTNWASANRVTVAAGNKWNGGATPNPISDLFSALQKSVLVGNLLILPENTSLFFFAGSSTTTRDYVQAGGPLPRILIASQKTLVSGSPAYLWAPANPNNVVLLRDPGDPDRIPSAMTLRWLGKDGVRDGREVAGMLVRSFRSSVDDADFIVVSHNDAEFLPTNTGSGATAGAIIVGAQQ